MWIKASDDVGAVELEWTALRHLVRGERPNFAFKPVAEQALRSNKTIAPQRLNAALGFYGDLFPPWSMKKGSCQHLGSR